ncbi:MAG TPA: CaiB/BaiF CoA-transferase family protein [Stellaceae bacterium]|nr:CaiB/BaiF CoA-transferase family protein [Stellaceae bacterium]
MAVKGPLSGVTVVDLSRILAGPYCTFLMAQLGARVIKVEAPGKGDDAREYGPFRSGVSTYFASVNRGKQSIALDLRNDADKRVFEKLLEKADVLVENFRPGTMEKFGYGWDRLHPRYPRLIYAAASGFGHTGPFSQHPAYDMVVQGLGGIMSVTGHKGQPPVRIGVSVGDLGAGLYATIAVNAALLHREKTGESCKVDIAMFDCQLALLENAIMRYTVTGEIPEPLGARHPTITPFEAFSTADNYIIIAAGNDHLFKQLCEALGRPEMAKKPEYVSNDLRLRNQPQLKAEIELVLRAKPATYWLDLFDKAGIPSGPINNIPQALAHPQVSARDMLVTVNDPAAGPLKVAGNPLKISGFPEPKTHDPAPALDADRAAILKELGL